MKKLQSSILGVLLIALVLATFAGCNGGDKDSFIGSWKTTINLDEIINESIAGEDEDMADYFKIEDFNLTMLYTFNEDGTYTVAADKDATRESFEKMRDALSAGLTDYLKAMLASEGVSMDIDDLLALNGTSLEEMMDSILSDEALDEMVAEMETTGNWKAEKGKLYTTESVDDDFDESEYETYTITSGKLTLKEAVGDDVPEEAMALYPIVLTKVK